MATENLGKLTNDQLFKKEKEANRVIIGSVTVFIVCLAVLIILKPVWSGIVFPLLAPAVIYINERKRIKEELKKRDNNA